MITDKSLKALEFDKVALKLSEYCVLRKTKELAINLKPEENFLDAKHLQDKTSEAFELLYTGGVSGIEFFDDVEDAPERAEKGSTLSMGELLRISRFLKSSRILSSSILSSTIDAPILKAQASAIFIDAYLENEIRAKIISEDTMSDNASDKLYSLRKLIKRLNEQIKEKLSSFIRAGNNKYLQENIITMRGDRYVLPVKSEYRGQISGFIHDQSSTGATVFIEPTAVLELNNSLKTATLEEQLEVERILADLSQKVGVISKQLKANEQIAVDIDLTYGKATYAYKTNAIKPNFNSNGRMNIVRGRHPLIHPKTVVPVSVKFGYDYNYLLVTGPNTGGKTVTLKMVGLFSVMATCGMFVQAEMGSEISYFKKIFCDVGDEQSIEQSLSTFSSHMKNIIDVTNNVDGDSLVLIDEIGAGTDPDEGSALARAIIEKLLDRGSYGIITTHYSALKEFAYSDLRIKNAGMEFDSQTFAPLYKINIGMPGSSNAIEISKRLGLGDEIAEKAYSFLSGNKISFEKVLKEAEKSRQEALDLKTKLELIKIEEDKKLKEINDERQKLEVEKERFYTKAKAESRRIVSEKLQEADDIIEEIKVLFDKEELTSGDLIRARTLRNKLEDKKYDLDEVEEKIVNYSLVNAKILKVGDEVFYKPTESICKVNSINEKKGECEIFMGTVRIKAKLSDLFFVSKAKQTQKTTVAVKRESFISPLMEINVIGLTVLEAIPEIESFIDQAIVNNLEEVKIIHGKGLKILSTAIHDFLRRNKRVESYRFGKYGEGERGVTFVKLK
ncbi:MAG: endonuclease MutS2 [Clostridia bacterium]|nr:endonuclease MutS2 [Clostridia bacterium]